MPVEHHASTQTSSMLHSVLFHHFEQVTGNSYMAKLQWAKLQCNICHEYGVSGTSRKTLLYSDYTRAPWWTQSVATYRLPPWLHWLLFFLGPVVVASVIFLLSSLFHFPGLRNFLLSQVVYAPDLPVPDRGNILVVLSCLVLGLASELNSRFWQRRLGLRQGMFHCYQCRFCSSHWEWIEVSPQRSQHAQAGTTEPQSIEPTPLDVTTSLES
jgi:hypothetical protein